jgi:hypothetical protein
MIFERLKQNIRLLEQLTIFNQDHDAIPGLIPDTAEYLFLSGEQRGLCLLRTRHNAECFQKKS